jgi:hypothetical protein
MHRGRHTLVEPIEGKLRAVWDKALEQDKQLLRTIFNGESLISLCATSAFFNERVAATDFFASSSLVPCNLTTSGTSSLRS